MSDSAARALERLLGSPSLKPFSFVRAHRIGARIADFCCPKRRVVVQIDGGRHAENGTFDEGRAAYFESRGYRVLRFWEGELLTQKWLVFHRIALALGPRPSETKGV